MADELALMSDKPLTVQQVKAQVQQIQELMSEVMVGGKDGHYGTIPGCGDKPTLFKSGAEKICFLFRLAPDPEVEDLSNEDEIRYRVKVKMYHAGKEIGAGVGEASSNEEKYKWRKAITDEEFEDTPEDRKRFKHAKDWNTKKAIKIKQIRTNPADVANTILKMAKKRGLVDGVLTVTAASDIFTQDLEDAPESGEPKPKVQQPRAKTTKAGKGAKGKGKKADPPKKENGGEEEKELFQFTGKVQSIVEKFKNEQVTIWNVLCSNAMTFSTKTEEHVQMADTARLAEKKVLVVYFKCDKGYKNVETIEIVG